MGRGEGAEPALLLHPCREGPQKPLLPAVGGSQASRLCSQREGSSKFWKPLHLYRKKLWFTQHVPWGDEWLQSGYESPGQNGYILATGEFPVASEPRILAHAPCCEESRCFSTSAAAHQNALESFSHPGPIKPRAASGGGGVRPSLSIAEILPGDFKL